MSDNVSTTSPSSKKKSQMLKYIYYGLGSVALLLVLFGVWVIFSLWRSAPVIVGYAGQIGCAATYISGLEHDKLPELNTSPASYANLSIDKDSSTLTADFFFASKTYYYSKETGCMLLTEQKAESYKDQLKLTDISSSIASATPNNSLTKADSELSKKVQEYTDLMILDSKTGYRSVLVWHDGEILAESYAKDFELVPLIGWSMGKSVAYSVAALLARDGYLSFTDQISNYFPQLQGKEQGLISINDLLSMSSGLEFEEVYEPGSDVTHMLFDSYDVAEYMLTKEQKHNPGEHYYYSSGETNLLVRAMQVALKRGANESLTSYVERELYAPLGIKSMVVSKDASGLPVFSSFVYANARDWLRFGLLFLNEGVFAGNRIISKGLAQYPRSFTKASKTELYGKHWWLASDNIGFDKSKRVPRDGFYASGHDNQYVYLVPSEQLAVVILGFNPESIEVHDIIGDIIEVIK